MLVKGDSYKDFECPRCGAGLSEDEPFEIPCEGDHDVVCPTCSTKFKVKKVVHVEWEVVQ